MYSSFSKKFRQIKPYDNYNVTDVPWHEAMVAGNGRLGVLESCAPIEDSLIYQNVEFVMPSEEPRHVPYDVTAQLDEARQSVINFDDTWNIHDRKRTNMYCYHPGHMIRLTLEGEPDISGYRRWTDYKTGTINTTFKSDGASVSKSTYVSRKQNVIITKIISEKSVNMSISTDDFESMPKFGVQKNNIPAPERNMLYSRFVRDNIIGTVVHYPEYEGSELAKGGFAGVTRILTDGDMRVSSKPKDSRAYTCIDETAPVINISHAESITLITYTDWTDDLGEYCEFRDRVNGKDTFALVDKCINKVNSVNITEEPVSLDHKNIELKLDGGYFCESANEELLDLQKNEYDIMPHLLEKLYYNGLYGMKDAVLIPVNTDGHRAMMVEYDINYPFQYWNAGAGWMLIPIYEFLQTYGDAVITTDDVALIKMYGKDTFDVRKDVYEPLLKKTYNFWKQIGNPEYYTDTDGNARYEKGKCSLNESEHYLIIPSFSPENKPFGYHSAITANAAMDISAAKDVINMYTEMLNYTKVDGYEQAVSEAEALLRLLPDFMYDESGAVKEWSMKEYGENNAHRHISHLYPAWPALQTQHDSKLAAACRQAVINRNHENKGKDDTASHGWIHKALVEARLKNADAVYDTLNLLVHSDIFYTTLFTDHNTDRSKGVYCTDTAFGLVGIINEMLVYSDEHTIELLPAWSDKLGSGMVKGLRTRCGITIDELKWDVDKKKVYVSLDWGNADEINIVCGKYEIEKIGHERQS